MKKASDTFVSSGRADYTAKTQAVQAVHRFHPVEHVCQADLSSRRSSIKPFRSVRPRRREVTIRWRSHHGKPADSTPLAGSLLGTRAVSEPPITFWHHLHLINAPDHLSPGIHSGHLLFAQPEPASLCVGPSVQLPGPCFSSLPASSLFQPGFTASRASASANATRKDPASRRDIAGFFALSAERAKPMTILQAFEH